MCERLAGGKERVTGKRNGEQKAWTGREEAARTQREKADGEERGGKSHGRACERLAGGKERVTGKRNGEQKARTGCGEAARAQRKKADGGEEDRKSHGRGAKKPRVRRGRKPTRKKYTNNR